MTRCSHLVKVLLFCAQFADSVLGGYHPLVIEVFIGSDDMVVVERIAGEGRGRRDREDRRREVAGGGKGVVIGRIAGERVS